MGRRGHLSPVPAGKKHAHTPIRSVPVRECRTWHPQTWGWRPWLGVRPTPGSPQTPLLVRALDTELHWPGQISTEISTTTQKGAEVEQLG